MNEAAIFFVPGPGYDLTTVGEGHVEEHQRFLMGELAHRGGNLLAVIQSIVSRSLAETKPLDEERNTLIQRLQALGAGFLNPAEVDRPIAIGEERCLKLAWVRN